MKKEFLDFLKQYNVIGLATAVIIGGKLNELVTSIVNDFFMPLFFQPALRAAHVDDIKKLHISGIYYGKVVGAGIDFFLVAMIAFFMVRFLVRDHSTIISPKK